MKTGICKLFPQRPLWRSYLIFKKLINSFGFTFPFPSTLPITFTHLTDKRFGTNQLINKITGLRQVEKRNNFTEMYVCVGVQWTSVCSLQDWIMQWLVWAERTISRRGSWKLLWWQHRTLPERRERRNDVLWFDESDVKTRFGNRSSGH